MRGVHLVAMLIAVLVAIIILVASMTRSTTTEEEFVGENTTADQISSPASGGNTRDGYMTFSIQMIPPAGSYLDRVDVSSTSDLDMMGTTLKTTTTMHMESVRTVQDLQGGGASVDTTITAASFHTLMQGGAIDQEVSCDLEEENKTSPENEQEQELETLMCKPFFDLIGTTDHFVFDEDGNIAEASGPGSELMQSMSKTTSSSKNSNTDKLHPSNTLVQASRLLKLLPGYPVQENEDWDSSVDMGDMGSFQGTSKFVGHQVCGGTENDAGQMCAVVKSEGQLEIDMETAGSKLLGDEMGALFKDLDIHITDAIMKATILWDEEHKISRWSRSVVTMTMTMKDPDGGPNNTSLPIAETITMITDIKE